MNTFDGISRITARVLNSDIIEFLASTSLCSAYPRSDSSVESDWFTFILKRVG